MDIISIIRECNFDKLSSLDFNDKDISDILSAANYISNIEENIAGYYACIYLESKLDLAEKKALVHNDMAIILSMSINFVNGAYTLGFYHARKAMEYDPNNLEYKLSTLQLFADVPDFNMSIEYKERIAKEILLKDSRNPIALKYV